MERLPCPQEIYKSGNMDKCQHVHKNNALEQSENNLRHLRNALRGYTTVTKFVYSATMISVQRKTAATIPVSAKIIYILIIRTLDQLFKRVKKSCTVICIFNRTCYHHLTFFRINARPYLLSSFQILQIIQRLMLQAVNLSNHVVPELAVTPLPSLNPWRHICRFFCTLSATTLNLPWASPVEDPCTSTVRATLCLLFSQSSTCDQQARPPWLPSMPRKDTFMVSPNKYLNLTETQ